MNKIISFYTFLFLFLASCTPKYIVRVDPDTKTKFGFEGTAPNVGIFFVENENSSIGLSKAEQHKKIADKLYNKYGPARDNFYIARTNAKDFKFNLKKKTYYIEVKNLPRRTAMITFDGKDKPSVYFNPEKYEKRIKQIIMKSKRK